MTAETLRALRKARGLSQRTAALSWGVDPHTAYRWEAGLRPIPTWLELMIEREKPLLKKIESQEKEIAALLLARTGGRPRRKALGRSAGGHRARA